MITGPQTETLRYALAGVHARDINVQPAWRNKAANSIGIALMNQLLNQDWEYWGGPIGNGLWPAYMEVYCLLWGIYITTPPPEPVEKTPVGPGWPQSVMLDPVAYFYDPYRQIPTGGPIAIPMGTTLEESALNFGLAWEQYTPWEFIGLTPTGDTYTINFRAKPSDYGPQLNYWKNYPVTWSTMASDGYNGGWSLRAKDVEYDDGPVIGALTLKCITSAPDNRSELTPGYYGGGINVEGTAFALWAQGSAHQLYSIASPYQLIIVHTNGLPGGRGNCWCVFSQPFQQDVRTHMAFAASGQFPGTGWNSFSQFVFGGLHLHGIEDQWGTTIGGQWAPAVMTMRFPIPASDKSLQPIVDAGGVNKLTISALLSMCKTAGEDGGIVGMLWNTIAVTDRIPYGSTLRYLGWEWMCIATNDGLYWGTGAYPWASILTITDFTPDAG